jgi:hypothetical protein
MLLHYGLKVSNSNDKDNLNNAQLKSPDTSFNEFTYMNYKFIIYSPLVLSMALINIKKKHQWIWPARILLDSGTQWNLLQNVRNRYVPTE